MKTWKGTHADFSQKSYVFIAPFYNLIWLEQSNFLKTAYTVKRHLSWKACFHIWHFFIYINTYDLFKDGIKISINPPTVKHWQWASCKERRIWYQPPLILAQIRIGAAQFHIGYSMANRPSTHQEASAKVLHQAIIISHKTTTASVLEGSA